MQRDGLDEGLWQKARVNKVVPGDIPERRCADDHYLAGNAQLRATLRRGKRHAGARGGFGRERAGVCLPLRLCRGACGVACSPAREALFRRAGAQEYVDYHAADIPARLRAPFPRRHRPA